MKTLKDVQALVAKTASFKCFISTINARGFRRMSIVKGTDARNMNEGEIVYQKVFAKMANVNAAEMAKI